MINEELKKLADKIKDIYWIEGYSDESIIMQQITYVLYINILNNKEYRRNFKHFSRIYEDEYECFEFINLTNNDDYYLKEKFENNIYEITRYGNSEVRNIFCNSSSIIIKPNIIKQTIFLISELCSMAFKNDTENGAKIIAEIYEYLLSSVSSNMNLGQFYTPRDLALLMTELIEPEQDEHICDFACGTGGFLVSTSEYLSENYYKKNPVIKLKGYDIDINMISLATMNLILHNIAYDSLEQEDMLKIWNKDDELFDVIISNPPVRKKISSEYKYNYKYRSNKSELLFIQRAVEMLKPGGRCALLIPEGFLFGSNNINLDIRKELLNNNIVEGIISLPVGVFQPHTNAKASIILFKKGFEEKNEPLTEYVWFYSLEDEILNSNDKHIYKSNNLNNVIKAWQRKEKDFQRWQDRNKDGEFQEPNISFATYKQILKNDFSLSALHYIKEKKIRINYEDPIKLLNEIHEIENEIIKELKELIEAIENE